MQFIKTFGSYANENPRINNTISVVVGANDNIVVFVWSNKCIQIFSKNESWKKTIAEFLSRDSKLYKPSGISVCKIYGRIFVTDCGNNRIQIFSINGRFLFRFGSMRSGNG